MRGRDWVQVEWLSRFLRPVQRAMPGERMKESHTTIGVSRVNRDRIAAFGKAGESLNDALSRILDLAELMQAHNVGSKSR
jgi:hypothetical protein